MPIKESMLLSFALILLCGLTLGGIMEKLKLPSLLGMMIIGIGLGPYMLDWLSPSVLTISADLRKIALIIILTRAGLALDVKDLKKVGRPAILLCFLPATFEIIAIVVFAPLLFPISYLEAAIMGAVLAAVSPAVVVPRMLRLMEQGYGKGNRIPQLIMTGAAVDDIYVIVLFTSFLGMYQGQGFHVTSLLKAPVAIVTGLALGISLGVLLTAFFKKFHIRDTVKILILLSAAFLLVTLEDAVKSYAPFSGLLAVMALGTAILKRHEPLAKRLSAKYSKIWVCAELLLFVLVGAAVDISYLRNTGLTACLLILLALLFRMTGVFVCLLKTNIQAKEKLFCAIAYLPKATVQAAIGSIPLSAGLAAGSTILTVAVLAIMITAPLGAIGVDTAYKKLLTKEDAPV